MDGFFRVVVGDFFKQFTDLDFNAKFFAQFADKALLEGFARFALAAGKFPKPAEVRVRRAVA